MEWTLENLQITGNTGASFVSPGRFGGGQNMLPIL